MLSQFKLPEALAWLAQETGREWTDSELFDLCSGRGIPLHAAPPLDAGAAVIEMAHGAPGGVRVAMRLGWRKAVLHPLHIGQLWQVGETEPAPAWEPLHEGDARRWAVFDPPVKVRREHLAIGRDTLQRIAHAWRAEAPPVTPEPAAAKWTPERVAEARAMRAKLKRKGHRDYMARTAEHFGVTPTRLRKVLGPDAAHAPPPTLADWPPRKVHRLK